MKVLNLYAGIGGNRKLWKGVKVTAVEHDPDIAYIYKSFFRQDVVIVDDAHAYLKHHFKKFDFIWSSPPCQTHSSFRQNLCVRYKGTKAEFPDLRLYEEIIFLRYNAICKWVVENVKPFYPPLIPATAIQRHLFWSNFEIPQVHVEKDLIRKAQIPQLQISTGFDLSGHKVSNKRQVLRNCIRPELGLHVLESAIAKQSYRNAA